MKVLELSPAPHEVAAARLPACMTVVLPGGTRLRPDEMDQWIAVPGTALGWGASVCAWYGPRGVALNHHKRDRAVWQQAARMLGRGDGLLVLYVVHEQRDWHGKTVWVAVRIRSEEEDE